MSAKDEKNTLAVNAFDGIFAFGGEMGTIIRNHDWANSSLGPIEGWSQSLINTIRLMLPSKAQMMLFWGSEFTTLTMPILLY